MIKLRLGPKTIAAKDASEMSRWVRLVARVEVYYSPSRKPPRFDVRATYASGTTRTIVCKTETEASEVARAWREAAREWRAREGVDPA